MKQLLVMRHAKSSWESTGGGDHNRPLNGRGEGDAPEMGRWIKKQELLPEYIISSTAKRAITTAKLFADGADYEGKIIETRDFYLADPDEYLEKLSKVSDQYSRVMVVGHNPGMSDLVTELSGGYENLTTANIAYIQLPINHWSELHDGVRGKLVALWRPRDI